MRVFKPAAVIQDDVVTFMPGSTAKNRVKQQGKSPYSFGVPGKKELNITQAMSDVNMRILAMYTHTHSRRLKSSKIKV